MTYSDEHASSQASFAGDQSGDIFADSVVAESPLTTVRVVETQSGFLVVVKDIDERLSLSVKRRIGTPPASQILLTRDESIKLSRILDAKNETNGRESTPEEYRVAAVQQVSPYGDSETAHGDDWPGLQRPVSTRSAGADTADTTANGIKIFAATLTPGNVRLTIGALGMATLVLLAGLIGATVMLNTQAGADRDEAASRPANSTMDTENVDKFVRNYVSNMLDFSTRSYKVSQIHAMAAMKPKLMKRYWRETNFPLSSRALKNLPKTQTLIISKVLQTPTSAVSTDVDLYAELVNPETNKTSPIHLELDVGLNDEGSLVVVEQKDVSGKKD